MNSEVLIVMQKNAIPGKVKTRLAKTIGSQEALKVYHQLLAKTYSVLDHADFKIEIHLTDFVENKISQRFPHQFVQEGEGLGERMWNSANVAFDNGAKKVGIIGVDCPDLTQGIIKAAFHHLNYHDTVIGPTYDGGYYLIALNKPVKPLFFNKNWGTSSVFQQTLDDFEKLGLTYYLLPKLNDLDTYEDLKQQPDLFEEYKSQFQNSNDI